MVYKNAHHEWNLLVNYSYLADSTKLSALDDDGDGLLYRGSLIYRKTEGEIALESILFEGGRFVPNGGPMLHVTDHLGSVRAVVNALSGEVTETSDYFPFGMRMDIWGAVEDESNRYRFNGKEDQEGEFGVPTLDYGARHYSATSARWLSMDPLAEKYYSVSPYAFCNNNPVNFVDPDGESWGKVIKIGTKVCKAVKAGNKVGVKGILKSEAFDIADNVHTILDSDASGFEKGIAAFDLVTGFGDQAKWLAKTIGVSDGVVDGAKATRSAPKTPIETTLDVLPENQINRELLDKPTKRGNAFVFKKDGTAVEIHHVGQSADGPYIEMHRSDHRGKGNYKENHPNSDASTQIDRKEFNKQRRYYWQKEYDKY